MTLLSLFLFLESSSPVQDQIRIHLFSSISFMDLFLILQVVYNYFSQIMTVNFLIFVNGKEQR